MLLLITLLYVGVRKKLEFRQNVIQPAIKMEWSSLVTSNESDGH